MTKTALFYVLAVVLGGCAAGKPPHHDEEVPPETCGEDQGPTPLRRLTRAEYDNTVRDLLGVTEAPARAFPPDENTYGFSVAGSVSTLLAEGFESVAQGLSETVSPLQLVLPCNPSRDGEDVCAQRLIVDIGKKAYRRPLLPDEIERLTTLYTWAKGEYENVRAMQLVLQALLQSPNFLYHVELGDPALEADGRTPLTQYEIASRLSYTLWASMPDDELFRAADAGELTTPEELEAQARRMLDDPRARDSVAIFNAEWLGLGGLDGRIKDPVLYPGFTEAVADSMREETLRFAEDVFFEGDGRLETLLTASYSFVDGGLAPIYGVDGISGVGLQRVELDPTQRSGILTHASILSINAKPDQTSPIHRGKFVRERLMCQPPPPPPPGFAATPPLPTAGMTTRERFSAHRTDSACASCHDLMDPIGFGFEHYDPIGGFRATEEGHPVDATGEIVESRDLDGSFDGVIELGRRLADSQQVSDCLATQWFRYAFGRQETEEDDCTIRHARNAMEQADGDMRELVIGLVTTESFRNRLPVEE